MNSSSLKELDESIYDLLESIRQKPGLYIVEPSTDRLQSFLTGYEAGLGRVGFALRDEVGFHKFHEWVANRLGFPESTSGWAGMIRARTASGEEAFRQFFVLLGEFRKNSN